MSKRQVIILWVIALLLGGAVAAVKISQQKATDVSTQRSPGQTLFPSFPGSQVATIEISGKRGSIALAKKENQWVAPDRGDYPARTATVNGFLRALSDLKVTRGTEAGPSLAPRFGMEEGVTATFKDATGKELAKITLGKNVDNGSTPDPMTGGGGVTGRFIWNHADDSGFYAVSEMFSDVSESASAWLAPEFFTLLKIKSIAVSEPAAATPAWKVSRANETAEFTAEGAAPGEVLSPEKATEFKTLFSYLSFEDVIAGEKLKERLLPDTTRTVTVETFEGFTYHLTISSAKPSGKPTVDGSPAGETVFLTVDVSATLPQERKKEAGEKPEDAKAKDEAFTTRLKTLTEKLAAEKKLSGHTFEIDKQSAATLLLPRKAVIVDAAAAAQAPAPQGTRPTAPALPFTLPGQQ